MKVTALVPMRHNSERVPGKNYRSLGGLPLYHHVVHALLGARHVERVIIDTDSERIADDAATAFPEVEIVERPAHLRDGHTPMTDVLLHTCSVVDAAWYLQTHSTNPFLRAETIDAAVCALDEAGAACDSLFSVTALRTRLWYGDGTPVNHDPSVLLRTQDLPPIYEENSNLYVFERATLVARGSRIGARPLMFEIPAREALDIDDEWDFTLARAIRETER
jgi:CMP-N-acetylneuraminic acid synthetase